MTPVRATGVSGGNHIILVLFLIYKYFMNLTGTVQIFWYMVKCLANISLVFNIKYKNHVCVCMYICMYCIPQQSEQAHLWKLLLFLLIAFQLELQLFLSGSRCQQSSSKINGRSSEHLHSNSFLVILPRKIFQKLNILHSAWSFKQKETALFK